MPALILLRQSWWSRLHLNIDGKRLAFPLSCFTCDDDLYRDCKNRVANGGCEVRGEGAEVKDNT